MNLNYNLDFILGFLQALIEGYLYYKLHKTPKQLNEERKTILASKLNIANSLRFAL